MRQWVEPPKWNIPISSPFFTVGFGSRSLGMRSRLISQVDTSAIPTATNHISPIAEFVAWINIRARAATWQMYPCDLSGEASSSPASSVAA